MRIKIVLLILSCNSILFAQYTGGKGDGYASDQQVVTSTALEDLEEGFVFYPTICTKGTAIQLVEKSVTHVVLTDVIGNQYFLQKNESNQFFIPQSISSGKYSIQLIADDKRHVASILIHD